MAMLMLPYFLINVRHEMKTIKICRLAPFVHLQSAKGAQLCICTIIDFLFTARQSHSGRNSKDAANEKS